MVWEVTFTGILFLHKKPTVTFFFHDAKKILTFNELIEFLKLYPLPENYTDILSG